MVYLFHFDKPLHHAQHYIGYCAEGDLNKRITKHKQSIGAKILAALNKIGIGYTLVRTWLLADKTFERLLKNQNNAPRYCPICKQALQLNIDLKTGFNPIMYTFSHIG